MDINPYDAIVVGSGATGGIAALTLAEQGKKVLIIEAGAQLTRKEASNYEPKATFDRVSGVLSKKYAKQSKHTLRRLFLFEQSQRILAFERSFC